MSTMEATSSGLETACSLTPPPSPSTSSNLKHQNQKLILKSIHHQNQQTPP